MRGRNQPSHRTQGGSHGQYNPPTPQAVVPERTSQDRRGLSPSTCPTAAPEPTPQETVLPGTTPPMGSSGQPEPTPVQAALSPAPQAGPHRLRAAGLGPDPTDLSAPRRAGPGRHPHRGRTHHRQPAPQPGRLGPGPLQQLSPRSLPPPVVRSPAGTPVHRRRLGSVCSRGPDRGRRRRYRHRTPRPPSLRQRVSPRPRPFHPLVHRLPLGTQVGRPGMAGPLPVRAAALGLAADGALVSARG